MDMSEQPMGRSIFTEGLIPVLKNIPEEDAAEELLKLIEDDQNISHQPVIELFLLKIGFNNLNINTVAKSINFTVERPFMQ